MDNETKTRRERIATAVLGHMISSDRLRDAFYDNYSGPMTLGGWLACEAVGYADALIAELDKEPGR